MGEKEVTGIRVTREMVSGSHRATVDQGLDQNKINLEIHLTRR